MGDCKEGRQYCKEKVQGWAFQKNTPSFHAFNMQIQFPRLSFNAPKDDDVISVTSGNHHDAFGMPKFHQESDVECLPKSFWQSPILGLISEASVSRFQERSYNWLWESDSYMELRIVIVNHQYALGFIYIENMTCAYSYCFLQLWLYLRSNSCFFSAEVFAPVFLSRLCCFSSISPLGGLQPLATLLRERACSDARPDELLAQLASACRVTDWTTEAVAREAGFFWRVSLAWYNRVVCSFTGSFEIATRLSARLLLHFVGLR